MLSCLMRMHDLRLENSKKLFVINGEYSTPRLQEHHIEDREGRTASQMDVILSAMRQIYWLISHPMIDIWSNYVHPPLYLCYMTWIHHMLSVHDLISPIYANILDPMHWSSIGFTLTFCRHTLEIRTCRTLYATPKLDSYFEKKVCGTQIHDTIQ